MSAGMLGAHMIISGQSAICSLKILSQPDLAGTLYAGILTHMKIHWKCKILTEVREKIGMGIFRAKLFSIDSVVTDD